MTDIVQQITSDVDSFPNNTSYYWYFGKDTESMTLMLKFEHPKAFCHINLKDFDFALNIEQITIWRAQLCAEIEFALKT